MNYKQGEGGAAAAFSPYSCRGRIVSANFLDRIRAVLLAILLTAAFAVPALAGPFEDAVAKFANDDFSDTDEAIGVIATSGNPLAFPIISALQDGRLMNAIKVYHRPADLRAALEGIGWEARIEPVAGGFFWGEAQAADR